MYAISYHYLVVENDIPKLSERWKKEVKEAIETKLVSRPEIYGKPLRRSLKNYRKLRVGDYRVIFRIKNYEVKILIIGHRSAVYKIAKKRSY